MSSQDLVMKVAQARNLTLPSGRVYGLAHSDVLEDVREAKFVLRGKGLLTYGSAGHPKMLPAGRSLLEEIVMIPAGSFMFGSDTDFGAFLGV
jgi:hypothetical protein